MQYGGGSYYNRRMRVAQLTRRHSTARPPTAILMSFASATMSGRRPPRAGAVALCDVALSAIWPTCTAYRTVRVADTATMLAAISTEFNHHQFTKHHSALLKNAAVEASFFTEFDRVLKISLAQISGCSDDK